MCSVFRPRANIGYCKLIVTRFVNCVCQRISSSSVIRLEVTNSVPWEDWACESSEDDEFFPHFNSSSFHFFNGYLILLLSFLTSIRGEHGIDVACKCLRTFLHLYPSFAISLFRVFRWDFSRLRPTSVSRNEKRGLNWCPCESWDPFVPILVNRVSR